MPLAVASAVAQDVVALLEPACDRIEVAGSIRRRSATVGDVEVVCIPHIDVLEVPTLQVDMFAGPSTHQVRANRLDELCDRLLAEGVLTKRVGAVGGTAWGSGVKWAMFQTSPNTAFAVDIFTADERTWGVTLTLRTGPNTFSRRLVTQREQGGYCPNDLCFRGARVRHVPSMEPLDTPLEADVFRALGIEYLEPPRRTDDVVPRRLAVSA